MNFFGAMNKSAKVFPSASKQNHHANLCLLLKTTTRSSRSQQCDRMGLRLVRGDDRLRGGNDALGRPPPLLTVHADSINSNDAGTAVGLR